MSNGPSTLTAASLRRLSPFVLVSGALGFGLVVYALTPARIATLDDDFGYLKSVVLTLQHHRPWTDAFLEPWSATHSAFSALAYGLTGNFKAATYGLQAVFAAFSFLAVCALLRRRALPVTSTIIGCTLLLSCPVLLWCAVEFTAMTLYLPCLLWAIWAAENRRWLIFSLVWVCAVASRQSAAAWLAWPAIEFVVAIRRRAESSNRNWLGPLGVLLGAALALPALLFAMNPTHARDAMLMRSLSYLQLREVGHTLVCGGLVFACAAGLAALTSMFGPQRCERRSSRDRIALGIIMVIGTGVLLVDVRSLTTVDRVPVWTWMGWLYLKVIVALACLGWLRFRVQFRMGPLVSAIGSLVLLTARPGLWDYYLVDVALLGFFSVRFRSNVPTSVRSSLWRPAVIAACSGIVLYHLQVALYLKVLMDDALATCTLYEHAMRSGEIGPLELADASFGYKGWKLYDYSVVQNHRRRWLSDDLLPASKSVGLVVEYADSLPRVYRLGDRRPHSREASVIASESFRIGWLWNCRYELVRLSPAPHEPGLRTPRFPLTDQEWRELISSSPVNAPADDR